MFQTSIIRNFAARNLTRSLKSINMHEVNEAKLAAQKLAKSGGETNELSIFEKIVQGQIPAKVAYKDDLVILIQLKINLSKFNISFSLIKFL